MNSDQTAVIIVALLIGVVGASAQSGPPAVEPANIRLNFKDTPLDSVLEQLSKEAGFAIIKDAEIRGRVDAISEQPLHEVH
ncbi:MAG: hypothetical protein ACPGVU_01360 [Limisphaerales bacterium]